MAQTAGVSDNVRYSGSPIPMGFAEAGQKKKVVVVEFDGCKPIINEHEVPCFRELIRISGTSGEIAATVNQLIERKSCAWLEIEVTSSSEAGSITSMLDDLLENTPLEVLRIKNKCTGTGSLSKSGEEETLEMLQDFDVFRRCLEANSITAEEHDALVATYKEAIFSMQSADLNKN
jgi:exonuclease SbcD